MKMLTRTWLMLFILVYSQEKCLCQVDCFTWDLYLGQLTLTCRVKSDGSPVAIFDNNGDKITNCSLQGKESHCQLFQEDQILAVNISNTELNVTVQRSRITDYNGQWICQHKSAVFRTNVSSLIGIIYETTVELEVVMTTKETSNLQDVELRCSSCRIPFGFNAEFLINNRSIDSVNYDPYLSTCYHGSGKCSPHICSCDSPGNHFTRKLRVDMSIPKLFSCDMIFIDTYTTAKFSKTSGMYLDAQGIHSIGTVTRIIQQGKPIDVTTGQVTNQDLSTVSANIYSTTKSSSTENKVPVALLVGLSVVGIITACLLLVLVCQYLQVRKSRTRNQLNCSNTDENDQLLVRNPALSNEMSMITTENTTESQKRWMLAGIFYQIVHTELTLHMKDKMTIFYQKLKKDHSINRQDFSKYLESLHGKCLNYQAVNENFRKFEMDKTKYDYKISDAETLTKMLLPCSLVDIGQSNDDSSLGFGELLDLLNTVDIEMPDTVKTEVLKIQKDCTDWFSNEEDVWTEDKLSSQIESAQLIAEYTGKTKQRDIRLLQGADIFNDPGLQDDIGQRGQELNLFVKKTGKSLACSIHRRMYALLKDNNAYNEFLKKKISEEKNIDKLTKLIMEIGMTVIKHYITLHVLQPLNKDFKSFLDYNKHQLFHAWHNKRRCCQCKSGVVQNNQCDLTTEQYASLFCLKENNKEKILHQDNTGYCICKIIANKDVTLDVIDFTIALCIMMHCTSTKTVIGEKEQYITRSMVRCTQNIRNCRNMIFSMDTSYKMPLDIYNAAWKETEKSIIAMSACMDAGYHDKIKNDIQSLQSYDLQDKKLEFEEELKQCEQDIKLSRNQQHERSFLSKLNELESGILRCEDHLLNKGQLKDLEWQTFKRNVVLQIKRYPIVPDENFPVHEVVIEVDAPNEWNIDEILEIIRNKASSLSQTGSVQIIETTLEAFNMIVEIDANIFHEQNRLQAEIEKFLWGLLDTCHIDFRNEAELEISMKLLKTKLHFSSKTAQTKSVDCKKHDIAQLRKMDEQKLKTKEDAYFTSSGVWSNEEFIFVERNNNSLIFYNFKTKKERVIYLPERPFGMAVMGEGKVVISFPEKEEIRISIIENGKSKDIDCKRVGGKCYTLAKQDAETVLVSIEKQGIYSYNIRERELKKRNIEIPDFVPRADELFCRAERVVHTCRENRSLYCYDDNGVLQWKISDVLKNPTAITLDDFGNVFATDFVSSKLYHISTDGRYHKVLLSTKDGLLHPSSLHFCENRNWLLIVNRDNGFVFCYEVLYK